MGKPRRRPATATIYDVAAAARVSPRTVSRYFNHPGKLAASTCQELARVVARLGFRPSAVANRLSNRAQDTLAVLATIGEDEPLSELHRLLLGHIAADLARHGKDLLLVGITPGNEERVVAEHLRRRKSEALLLLTSVSRRILEEITATGLPTVTVNWRPGRALPANRYVGIDYTASSREFADALLHRGRRLAWVAPPGEMGERGRAALDAAAAVHVDCVAVEFAGGADLAASADDTVRRLLAWSGQPLLAYCCSDRLALALLAAMQRAGRRVPDDLGIAGFDGLEAGANVHPVLTTVEQPWRGMAGAAAACLLGAGSGDIVLPTRIRWGGSC